MKIRITHKGKSVSLDTNFVAKKEDLDTKLRLKKVFVDRYLSSELNKRRDDINNLGIRVDLMTAAALKTTLFENNKEVLDFFEFSEGYLKQIEHKFNSYRQKCASVRRLKEFVGRTTLSPFEFKLKFLEDFQLFLRLPLRRDAIERAGGIN